MKVGFTDKTIVVFILNLITSKLVKATRLSNDSYVTAFYISSEMFIILANLNKEIF